MNYSLLFCIFLVLCSNAFAMRKERQINRLIDSLVQLNNVAGMSIGTIRDLIDNIEESNEKSHRLLDEVYDRIGGTCSKAEDGFKSFISKLKFDQVMVNDKINKAKSSITGAREQEYIEKKTLAERELDDINYQKKLENENFAKYQTETLKKLNSLKIIRDIIQDELMIPIMYDSFVQIDCTSVKTKIFNTEFNFRDVKTSLFIPMLSTLLQIAESKNFSDPVILQNIIDTIDKIINNLKEFELKHKNNYESLANTLSKSVQIKITEIQHYTKMIVVEKQKIENAKLSLTEYEDDIKYIQDLQKRKIKELEYFSSLTTNYQNFKKENYNYYEKMKFKVNSFIENL